MRFLKKLLLIGLLLFVLSCYYKIFDFNYGFSTSMPDDLSLSEVVGVKSIYATKLSDDEYLVVLQNKNNSYINMTSSSEFSNITKLYSIAGISTKHLSIIPLVIGIIVYFVILFYPRKKKRES